MWTVLEAFGNAATENNPNSTRSVHLFSVDLDQGGQIASMSIQMHFYDKWRLIDHPPNEFSFHIFYYLLAGIENIPALRKELYLDLINDDLKVSNNCCLVKILKYLNYKIIIIILFRELIKVKQLVNLLNFNLL